MSHFRNRDSRIVAACLAAICLAAPAAAGITIYEQDDRKIEIGARIQVQYARIDPDGGDAVDRIFFRRLRPYIAGTIYKNWMGKIAFDFGESLDAEEVAIKDAYMVYTGLAGNKMYIGNSKAPFSREFMTSSKRLELVSRSFAGDHNFGTPDRILGYRNDGGSARQFVTYSVAAGGQHHDPDMNRMDFDTPVNNRADWNEGALVAGRVDFNPRGLVKFSQADFRTRQWKYALGASTFLWANDDDNNTYTLPGGIQDPAEPDRADLDNANGYEISGALRGHGLSIDVNLQQGHGETVVSDFTGGLYLDGQTDMDILAFQGGYMFRGARYEIAFGWSSLDADNYEDAWSRTILGFNYYLNKHNLKMQANYTFGRNAFGVADDDANTLQVQMQFVF